MATKTWNNSSDNWTTPADWTGGTVPAAADDVVIASGNPQVTTNVGTVATVTESSFLSLASGHLGVTATFNNSGQLVVDRNFGEGGSTLAIGGTLTNTNYVNIGNGGLSIADTVSAGALINTGGRIDLSGSSTVQATLNIASAAGTQSGTTGHLTGTVNLGGDTLLEFASGQISTNEASLSLSGANARVANATDITTNSALTGLTSTTNYIELDSGASISPSGNLANSGQIYLDRNFSNGGAKLSVGGTLTNTNYIDVGNGGLSSADTLSAAALINAGGRIDINGSATVQATVNIASAAGTQSGTTGHLTGTVNLSGDTLLEFASGQITTNEGALSLSGSNARIANASDTTTNSALTGLTATTNYIELDNGASVSPSGNLANSGQIFLDRNFNNGGAKLSIGGTLTNTNYIDVGNGGLSSADTLTAAALINTGGRIDINGSSTVQATVNIASAAGTQSGTTGHLTGTVNLGGDTLLAFASGQISTNEASLSLSGSNARIANATDTTSNSALTGLTSTTNYIELDNGASISPSGNLANSGQIYLDRNFSNGGAKLSVGGTLTNTNYIDVGNGGLSSADTLSAAALINAGGRIDINGSATVQATVNIASAAGTQSGTTGHLTGTVNLSGDTLLEFASGQITTNEGALSLSGSNARIANATDTTTNSALTGLTATTNYIELDNGASVSPSGNLANSGQIFLDRNFSNGGAKLSVGGTLTNTNLLSIGNGGLSAADTVSAAALVNTGGSIALGGSATTQATLNIGSAAGTGTLGHLTGSIGLGGDTLLEFASGQIGSNDASLSLNGANARIANATDTTSNSALTGLTTNTNYIELDNGASVSPSGNLANSGQIFLDRNFNNGGAKLSIGGTLTNTNLLSIGNGGLSAADTVSAAALVNTGGSIALGGSATTQATLNIGSAAGTGTLGHLTGSIGLGGDTLLEFASGQIGSNDASLSLNGANARIANATDTTSNSALTGLTTNTNYIELDNGASVSPSGNLANSGQIFLDRNFNNGGSSLAIGGMLTNTNYIGIGNGGLSSADTITAAGLNNTGGRIDLGGSSSNAATLGINGAVSNSGGQINANAFGKITTKGFTQGATGSVSLEIQGQAAGQFATIATVGAETINGGTLFVPITNTTLGAGQIYDLTTFTSGSLTGIFNAISVNGITGDGTTVNLGNGLLAGLVYGDSAGHTELQVVAAPATTTDTWTAGTGTWNTAANWSNGAPTFYSNVVIGSTSTAKVTLGQDATIDSLTVGASDTLTTQAATDLSIGSTVAVGAGATLTVGGEMFADGATTNNGSIVVGGTITDLRGASSGTGSYTINSGATLEFGGSESNTVNFGGANATLKLDQPGSVSGTLANLVVGDKIDLVGTAVSGVAVNGTNLTVTKGDATTLTYTLANQQANTGFAVQSDGAGGTNLVVVATTQPTFSAVVETPSTGDFNAGKTGTMALSTSVSAVVTGTPTLTLNDGGTASYDAAKSTATSLVFDYTVTAGQNAASLAATAVNLPNGATIKDGSNTNFNLSLSNLTQTGPQIDTTAPSIAITNAGGPVASASQVISGTASTTEVGKTVSVYDNASASPLGTAVVQSNGTWSTSVTLPAIGGNSLVATVTDGAGNTGQSTAVVYTYGVAPALTAGLASDTGSSGTDGLTNNDTISGSGDPSLVVTFKENGSTLGTTTAASSGAFRFTPTAPFAHGVHTLAVSETNQFGTTTKNVVFTYDTVAPTVAIASAGGPVSAAAQTVSGTASVGDAGQTVSIFDNSGTTAIGTAVVSATGTWSTTVTLPASGANSLVATVTDKAGNTGSSSAVVYSYTPLQPPTVTETLASDTGSNTTDKVTSNPTLTGTGAANTLVTIKEGANTLGTTTSDGAGNWSFTPTAPFAQGSHTVTASETNSAGTGTSTPLAFTYDSVAPSVTTALAADTGTAGDKITANDTITGTGDANAVVTVKDGATTLGTATANGSGVWSFTPGATFAQGAHSITATETDLAGNVGTSTPLAFTYDTVAPVVTTALVADTGTAGDKITANDALTGTGDANAVVTIKEGTTTLGTTTANSSGIWSFTPTAPFAQGAHSITANETDRAGNVGTSTALAFTYDTVAPTVSITSAGGPVNAAAQTVSGTASVGDAGQTVSIFDNSGTTAIGTAVVSATGTWSTTVTLPASGANSLVATMTDRAGNTGSSGAVVYSYTPLQPPTVTETLASDTGSNTTDKVTSNPTLTGTGAANTLVTIKEGANTLGTTTSDGSGNWSFTPTAPFAQGSHTVTASETNSAGTGTSTPLTFTYDSVAPSVTTALAADTGTAGDKITANDTITGTGDANAVVTVKDGATTLGTATANGSGVWSFTPGATFAQGAHSITATETDLAGNVGTSTPLAFTYDTVAPVVTTALVADTGTAGDKITANDALTGTGDANAVVTIKEGTTTLGTTTANSSGIWSFTPTAPFAQGAHSITATETDGAGNVGTSTALAFTYDTVAPTVAITSAGGPVNAAAQTVSGTASVGDAGQTVSIFDNSGTTAIGTAVVSATGAWSTTVTLPASGANSLVAKVTDKAGNTGSSSAVVYSYTPAQLPVVTEALVADTGKSATDKVTANDALTGIGIANAVVTIKEGTTTLGTTTSDATGKWTFTPPAPFAQGSHTVTASETNSAGTGTSTPLTFTYDNKRPTVTAVTENPSRGNLLTGQTDQITLAMSEPVVVAGTPTLTLNDGGVATYDAAHSTATSLAFTYTVKAGQATQELAVTGIGLPAGTSITDAAGNTANFAGAAQNLGVAVNTTETITGTNTLDIVGPSGETVIFAQGAAGTLELDAAQQFTGTVSGFTPYDTIVLADLVYGPHASATYTGKAAGGNLVVSDGTHTSTIALVGDYTTTSFKLTDDGNGGIRILDNMPPAVTEALKTDTGASATDKVTSNPTLTGTGDPNATVTFMEGTTVLGTTTANSAGAWTYKPTLADGTHTVTASETNPAGTGSQTLTFVLDTTKPAVTEALVSDTGSSATDRITSSAALTGGGDANAVVSFTVDGIANAATATANASGVWTYSPVGLSDGPHTIVANETDLAGNAGTKSLTITLDTRAPTTAITSTGGAVSNAVQTITGTGEAGTTVALYDGGAAIGTPVTVASNGTWSRQITLPTLGDNVITAKDTDKAGNVGTSQPVTYSYDHPPVITSGGGGTNATYVVSDLSAAITTVRATDADAGDTVTYSLLDQNGNHVASTAGFTIDPTSGALSFANTPTTGTYAVTAVASDTHGGSAVQNIKVNVGTDYQLTGDTGDHGVTDTFVFSATQPFAQIANFRAATVVSGGNTDPHGILALSHTLFTGATAGTSGNAATALIASHSAQLGADTVILTDQHTVIDLQNVNRTALLAHSADFAFT